jgi:flagellar hook capping protein FlgD
MSLSRGIGAATMVLSLALGAGAAGAEDLWRVRSGQVTFHLNVSLLRDLGLELVEVESSASPAEELWMEEPNWTFAIREGSDLKFRTEHGIVLPNGLAGGAIRFDGAITVRERTKGREFRLDALEIAQVVPAEPAYRTGGAVPLLCLRSAAAGGPVFCELLDSMFEFERETAGLKVHYLNARISESWARAIDRPDLAGWFVGIGEVRSTADLLESIPPTTPPYEPHFEAGILDVSLGALPLLQQVAHEGNFPGGFVAVSMSTTACNLGNADVPWRAPMREDHPLIHMALYRLFDGRFEQIGVSWLKHGFYALANEECTPCQGASSGNFLRAGCSDTYGVGNNSDRGLLGPRREVNAYAGTWECTGSHFAGGVPDCRRRHGGTGHGPLDHRLVVADADLGNTAATYFYEACYVVQGDKNPSNNWGSRSCVTSWNGSVWNFSVSGADNPLLPGPALTRWGERATYVDVAPGDGQALLAVQTTDLGAGTCRYEYALLNVTSDRQIRFFSLPILGVQNLTNIGFHDSDSDPTNDWQVTVDNGTIAWQTETYAQNPNAHALEFGLLYNFRFDAYTPAGPPTDLNSTLGLFKPGLGTVVAAATRGPLNAATAVAASSAPAKTRLIGIRPNPAHHSATVQFELGRSAAVRLDVHDAAGRLVRTLVDERRGAGAHAVVWNGRGESGERVGQGVYYVRLRSDGEIAVKSVVIVK